MDRRDLRHADTGHHARGADGTRADTDLDAVRTVIDQCLGRSCSGDVAADHIHLREILLDPLHAAQHALRMAVRGVHHDHVHARLDQQSHALFRALAHADRSANAQATEIVLAGIRMFGGFEDVLDGDQAAQFECIVHHQHAFDTMLVHQAARFVAVRVFLDGDKTLARRHDVGDGLVEVALEAQVAVGHDAHHLLALQHRQAGDLVLAGQIEHVAHRHVRRNGDRIFHHTALETLDLGDLCRLLLGRHVLVHDADAAFLRQGDRQARLGDGIHRCRQQRDVQGDIAGKLGAQTDIARQDVRMCRKQQHIVEGESFLCDTHGRLPLQRAHYIKTCVMTAA